MTEHVATDSNPVVVGGDQPIWHSENEVKANFEEWVATEVRVVEALQADMERVGALGTSARRTH